METGPKLQRSSPFRVDLQCLLMAALGVLFLAGCASQPADTSPVDLAVRVYVDRDEDGTWNAGDVPLPNVSVTLDGESTSVSNEEGLAIFEAVSKRNHTLALDEQEIAELESHALLCESPSRTVRVTEATTVQFCFSARGFLQVDVEEERKAE